MTDSTVQIELDMTMADILERVPSAQRALFQRYHVGGCSACGFQPSDTLRQVCKDHNILDTNEVVQHILRSHELDTGMQIEPTQVKVWLDEAQDMRFIDVRMPQELELARLPQAEPLDYNDSGKYMNLPKDTKLIFACKTGDRALDVAAYFAGHGFTNVWSLRGGLDAWRAEIDPSIPAYEAPAG
ncbi:MAG: rhodanese-like domain-containing protein [Planctomycetota bacterium]